VVQRRDVVATLLATAADSVWAPCGLRARVRPQADCIMSTRDNVPFCAVCRRAIDVIIDLYSRG
jgi:hypothetical protein